MQIWQFNWLSNATMAMHSVAWFFCIYDIEQYTLHNGPYYIGIMTTIFVIMLESWLSA